MTSKQIFNNLNEYFRDNTRDLINNRWLFTMINITDWHLKLLDIKYDQIHIEEAFKRYYFFFFIFIFWKNILCD